MFKLTYSNLKIEIMKKIILLLIILCYNGVTFAQLNNKKFLKKNKDVLSLNAIVAEKTYYSQAILEYQLVKKIIAKFSTDSTNIILKDTLKYVSLFKNLSDAESQTLGLNPCSYKKPEILEDLKSGFQFRHYLFKSNNSTAIKAFGIINNEIQKNDLFVVIDFIQYQDCECTGMPKIRYGVGMRAEFKISGVDLNKSDNKEINNINIENLAANVQFGKLKVDISIKTIGITGIESRFSIPSNTTFDVQTYGEYKSIINFIKNLNTDKSKEIIIQPEIIPVMDEYRTSVSEINTAIYEEMDEIKKRYKKLSKQNDKDTDSVSKIINSTIESSIQAEIISINSKKTELTEIDKYLNNLKNYNKILQFVSVNKSDNDSISTVNSTSVFDLISKNNSKNIDLENDYQAVFRTLLAGNLDKAKTELQNISKQKENYGNVYEILKIIKSKTTTNEVIKEILNKKLTWLIDQSIINEMKKIK